MSKVMQQFVIVGGITIDKKTKTTWWERGMNPHPKLRMTQGQKSWLPAVQRYMTWKKHVIDSYIDSLPKGEQNAARMNEYKKGKPIVLKDGERAHMQIFIHWWDETHGDPENIFGSIADALFVNDKHLSASADFICRDPNEERRGMVEVAIIILNKHQHEGSDTTKTKSNATKKANSKNS